MSKNVRYGPIRVGGDNYMDAHLDFPQKQFTRDEREAIKAACDHPACWGPCGKCGAHVHENEHGRFCPNCGAV
jgi:hypothetical protein